MFFKKSNRVQNSIDTLIGADTRVEGDIHFSGGLRVDGQIKGNVTEPADQASTLILSVILIIIVLLLEFAFYPELLAGLILYLCLESKAIDKKALRIAKLTKQNQKSAARELLKPLVARDVTKLSGAGIIKALIESLILRTARYYFVVIFVFLANFLPIK